MTEELSIGNWKFAIGETMLILIVLLSLGSFVIYVLPQLSLSFIGVNSKPFEFIWNWDFAGLVINLIATGYYALFLLIFYSAHYTLFAFIHNNGLLDNFYTEVLNLSPKNIARLNSFFNRKISLQPVRRATERATRQATGVREEYLRYRKRKEASKSRTVTDDIPQL